MAKRKKIRVGVEPTPATFVNGMWHFDISIEAPKPKKKRAKRKHSAYCYCGTCAKEDFENMTRRGLDPDDEHTIGDLDREIEVLQERINTINEQNLVLRHQLREHLAIIRDLERERVPYRWTCETCDSMNHVAKWEDDYNRRSNSHTK